jgi:hypothetical protein
MIIHFASSAGGSAKGPRHCKRKIAGHLPNRLLSYYEVANNEFGNSWIFVFLTEWGRFMPQHKVNLFLDSGAFSAFTKGVVIDIQEYIAFIKENLEVIEVYANLDVIGDPKATLDNQQIMEAAGLKPLPCFHYGEPAEYLEYYLDVYDYVALGGMVPISTSDLMDWLDRIFAEHICGADGLPKNKIHGFGLTSLKLMLRYPWYSVDSTSWVMVGRMGSVLVPKRGDYLVDPWRVVVSDRSPSKTEVDKHFKTYPEMDQKVILEYLTSKGYKIGHSEFRFEHKSYDPQEGERWHGPARADGSREIELVIDPGLSNDYMLRDELNIIYFLDLEKAMPQWPWPFNQVTQSARPGGLGL